MTAASKSKSKNAKSSSSNAGLWLIIGGVILLLLVGLLLWMNNRPAATPSVASLDVPPEWIDGASIGNPEAKVVIQAWEDFICPACQQWTAQVEPNVMEEYVKTGKVRLEFHQFPLQQHSPGALMAAQASLCAADQNLFWPYQSRTFAETTKRGQSGATFDELVKYATDLGLDTNAFRTCMNNLTHQTDVATSLTTAQQLGLSSTPSILLNGQLVESPFNYNALKAEIDAQLGAGS